MSLTNGINLLLQIKQWLLAPNLRDSQITRANLARRVTFFSKIAFGECWRVWQVLQNSLANVGESGEYSQSGSANVDESGKSCECVSTRVLAKVHIIRYLVLCTNNIFYMYKMV